MDKSPLEKVNQYLEDNQEASDRDYLGFSEIGNPCSRQLWYSYNNYPRKPFTAQTLKHFADGHAGEAIMVDGLRKAGIMIYGQQTCYSLLGGRFKGHCDGLMDNMVWEHKSTTKNVHTITDLMSWNYTYYVQAQMYMHCAELDKHYTTISSAGERDTIELYTDYNPAIVQLHIEKAEYIIETKTPPDRVRDDSSYYLCKFCDFRGTCYGA